MRVGIMSKLQLVQLPFGSIRIGIDNINGQAIPAMGWEQAETVAGTARVLVYGV